MLPAVDDLAELGAPVADVVVGDDVVAEMAGDPRQGVTENGAADVADVHRLGHVRRAEIDDDGLGLLHKEHAETLIHAQRVDGLREGGIQDLEVNESGACDARGFAEVLHLQVGKDLGRDLTRILLQPFGRDHRGIGLVVTEARVGRSRHDGQRIVDPGATQGISNAGSEGGEEGHGMQRRMRLEC